MGILMGVQFLAVLVAAIAWCQPGAKAVRCDDVTRLDFKNLVVRTAGFSFAFHNGFALNSDDPLAEKVDEEKPDWKAEIETDKVIRPAPGVVVRLLVIHDVHQTGSGRRYFAAWRENWRRSSNGAGRRWALTDWMRRRLVLG